MSNGEDKTIDEDLKQYASVRERYYRINENDLEGAFKLSKDALIVFDRWSYRKYLLAKESKRGENSALKQRYKEVCEVLYSIHLAAKSIWVKGKEDIRNIR